DAHGSLGAIAGTREVAGVPAPRPANLARRRRDREGGGLIDVAAAEVGGLVERRQARVQPRDEGVPAAAGGALGAAAGAREVRGSREAGDVDLARHRRDREGLGPIEEAGATEVGGLVERGEARVQARDEGVPAAPGGALGATAGAR